MAKPAKARRRASSATGEEQAARKYNTPLPYFRLEDNLCRSFLEMATDPREFDGLKLLFPFIREMSLLRFPRAQCKLSDWMRLAFMAGHDLGRAHPDRLEDVLPGLELHEAERRLGVIQNCSGEERLSYGGLSRACDVVVKANWAEVPEGQLETVVVEATLKSLRTGYAAATISRFDPVRSDFVWDMPERIGDGISDITTRFLVGAPKNAVGKSTLALLEHPLLKLAREMYLRQPIQCEAMLEFLRGQLRVLDVKSGGDCPASESALLEWIAAGIQHGTWLKANDPRLVQQIFDECGPKNFEDARSIVRKAVAKAGSADPARLLPWLKLWQKNVYGWEQPAFYGEELARVVYFSDFAVWIPWGPPPERGLRISFAAA